MKSGENWSSWFRVEDVLTLILPFATIVALGGGLSTQKPVILTIYHMQPFRASVLIQE